MSGEGLAAIAERQDWMKPAAEPLQKAVGSIFQGQAGQKVENFLHGTWLGHPLHPALTDVPIGAWTTALALDLAETGGCTALGPGADAAVMVGLVGAVASAVTGLTDWHKIDPPAREAGMAHGMLNSVATLLYLGSLICRRQRARGAARLLGTAGYISLLAAAYLGGHLVYGERIGVDHTAGQEIPTEFVPVMEESELPEGTLKRVSVSGVHVLLVRCQDRIHALAETCTHLGGPLSEGKLEGCSVQCPWHGSRFSLQDGRVLDGPATFPLPCYEVRVRDRLIEVRQRG